MIDAYNIMNETPAETTNPLEIIIVHRRSSSRRPPIQPIAIRIISTKSTLVRTHTHIDVLGLILELLLDIQCLCD
jgi:hypothetical protein